MGNVRKSEVLQKRERRILVETIRKEDEVIEFVAIVEDFKLPLPRSVCVRQRASFHSFVFGPFFFRLDITKYFLFIEKCKAILRKLCCLCFVFSS